MKKISKTIPAILLFASLSLNMTSCLGSFALFKKVQKWNGSLGDKWINSVIHAALWIIPVYEICLLADLLVLNTLEFWQGKSPLEMNSHERETQEVTINHDKFLITAKKNRFDIEKFEGIKVIQKASLFYKPNEESWYIQTDSGAHRIIKEFPDNHEFIQIFYPFGESKKINIDEI